MVKNDFSAVIEEIEEVVVETPESKALVKIVLSTLDEYMVSITSVSQRKFMQKFLQSV